MYGFILADGFYLMSGRGEIELIASQCRFAGKHHARALLHYARKIWLVKPNGLDYAGLVFHNGLRQCHFLFPCAALFKFNYFSLNRYLISGLNLFYGDNFGKILITRRKMKKKVGDLLDIELFETLGI